MSRFFFVLIMLMMTSGTVPRFAFATANDNDLHTHVQAELQHIAALIERGDTAGARLYLSASSIITSVMVWDIQGERQYPTSEQLLHVLDQPVIDAEKRLRALVESANPWRAEKVDISGAEVFYCFRTQQLVCALINIGQLANQFSITPEQISQQLLHYDSQPPHRTWFVVGLMTLAILLAFAYYLHRLRFSQAQASEATHKETGFSLGDLTVFPRQLRVIRQGAEIDITERDLKLLQHFASHPDEVITKQELYDAAWGREFMPSSRALEQHIITLRNKLDPQKDQPQVIETVHGQGYRFSPSK